MGEPRKRFSRSHRDSGVMTMNVYEIVTERIVSLLEQGVVPWVRREVA
jgi:antirestriction protein ArdC